MCAAALAGACALPLADSASGTVVQGPAASGEPAAAAVPEMGGNRVVPSGPVHVTCTRHGVTFIEGDQVKHLAVSPLTVIGALSFQAPGEHGRTLVVPFGDSGTTCVLTTCSSADRPAAPT